MRKLRFSQTQIIALGFFLVIGLGTLLLMLPFATRDGAGAGLCRTPTRSGPHLDRL